MELSTKQRRRKYWLRNFINFKLERIMGRRSKNTWVFGCWEGLRYDDNSRYLFEYVNEKHPEIECVWVTKNKEVFESVTQKGFKVVLIGTSESKLVQQRAGVAFYTNGLDDFGDVCYVYGAKIVALWHGVGMKKIYYNRPQKYGLAGAIKRIKDKAFSWIFRDLTISTSELANKFFASSFDVSEKDIVITGQPRNDLFHQRLELTRSEKQELQIQKQENYILYMPTHRPYADSTIVNTLQDLAASLEFVQFLRQNNLKFISKLHYLTKVEDLQLPEEFIILKGTTHISAQRLLRCADMLVTDYSSCIIDFAVSGKPSLLYTPDYSVYFANVGLISPWPDIYGAFAVTKSQKLVQDLVNGMRKNSNANATTGHINKLFESENIRGSVYSENVYNAVVRKLI